MSINGLMTLMRPTELGGPRDALDGHGPRYRRDSAGHSASILTGQFCSDGSYFTEMFKFKPNIQQIPGL